MGAGNLTRDQILRRYCHSQISESLVLECHEEYCERKKSDKMKNSENSNYDRELETGKTYYLL